MRLEIDTCTVEIDENATREYYAAHIGGKNDCQCAECRNFRAAAPLVSEKVKAFFRDCGIDDMLDFVELTPYSSEKGDYLYGGWYHLVGSIEGGKSPKIWLPPAARMRRIFYKLFNREKYEALVRAAEDLSNERTSGILKLDECFSVWFSNRKDLIAKDFPENCIQLDIDAKLPWVIEEKPE